LGTTDIGVFVGNLVKAILGLSGVAAFAMFIWGGVQWIISRGDKKRVESGQQTLTWATLGLIFIFIAYALLQTALTLIGQAGGGT
jgi:TRAP-type C4-dicarboxylate transport system permease small subunit